MKTPTLLSALLILGGPMAMAQEPGEKLCGDCQTTGKIAAPHRESVLEREKDVIYCSYWMDRDPEKLCMDWIVCPKCLTPSVQARAQKEFDLEFSKRKEWLEKRRAVVDRVTRKECWHVETEHFLLSWNIPEIKVERQVIKLHDAMHLYAERAEEVYDKIQELVGVTDQQMLGGKINFYMLETQREAKSLAPTVTDLAFGGTWHTYKVGPDHHESVAWDNPEKVLDDEHRHQYYVHAISHHVFNEVHEGNYTIWTFKRYGWVYEGLAFHMEYLMFGPPKMTCGQETGQSTNYRGKSWEVLVKKAVLAGEDPPFQEVITRSVDALSDEERRVSWSYIDYLMHLDAKKMPQMLSLMKGPQLPTRDCLKQAYGLSVGQFVDGWKEYVKETYSLRPRKGPLIR
ncbi:MAG: hypothetical protein V2A76_09300 [Planctomycetota bacterium]